VSPTGYINDELAIKWLDHFNEQTKEKAGGRNRILFIDGHRSHHTWRFLLATEAMGIIGLGFPPNTTHALQHEPLLIAIHLESEQFQHWMLLDFPNSNLNGSTSSQTTTQ
jgi:hypothetical protein